MSELKQKLTETIKTAMKAGEKQRVQHARTLSAALKQKEIDTRQDLTDDDVVGIVSSLVKQRRESIDAAQKAGRDEMVADEQAELAFLQEFLPPALSEGELREMIGKAITESGASTPRDMGKVMKLVTPQTRGRADGKVVSGLVKDMLAG